MPRPCPPPLFVFSAVELLERFAANLLGALLLFFLTERLRLGIGDATRLVGGFHALSYALAVVGGWLADRFLGSRRTAGAGLVFLTLGYLVLTVIDRRVVAVALALLVIGHGLFKPNIIALVGTLYPDGDNTRRERAYRLLYLVINVGAVLGPIIGALVVARAGWSPAFGTAGAALAIASVLFCCTSGARETVPSEAVIHGEATATPAPPQSYGLLVRLLLGVVLFEAAMNQTTGTLLVFARDHTRRVLASWMLPPVLFASLPALFALIIAPLATGRRQATASARSVTARLRSLAWSPIFGLVAFGLLAAASGSTTVSALWLVAALLLLTIGELHLYGRGLALLSELVPGLRGSLVYGLWFVASAVGQWLAGQLGALFARWPAREFFLLFVALEAVAALVFMSGHEPK